MVRPCDRLSGCGRMRVVKTLGAGRAGRTGVVGLVPTMGFFHEGHLSLMRRSASECDFTVATLYVNPLQFDDAADLVRYPANLEGDMALAEANGVDLLIVPPPEEMFAVPPMTTVSVPAIGDRLEGEFRPGHMTGVATVVAKLLAALQPDRSYFGRKDAQQLALVKRLVRDLSFPVEVMGLPLIREEDGLALSSRNIRLGACRTGALGLSRGLMVAADRFDRGARRASLLADAVRESVPEYSLEYVRLCDSSTMADVEEVAGEAYLLAAARFGSVRLIDNIRLVVGEGRSYVDRGIRLQQPSLLYDSKA